MKTETKQPLYKVLNEQRTQGEWQSVVWANKKPPHYKVADHHMELIADVYGPKPLGSVDSQYIALAVNNLHLLAEALEGVIRVADRKTDEFDKAKEALSKIS